MPKISKSCLTVATVVVVVLFACSAIAYSLLMEIFSGIGATFQLNDCVYRVDGEIPPEWYERFPGFKLPPSARDISATCESWQDYVAYVRFTMDSDDLDGLIASSLVKPPLSTTEKPFDTTTLNELSQLGWDVESITSFLAGKGKTPSPSLYQSIFIDTSNPSQYIVYVVTFSI